MRLTRRTLEVCEAPFQEAALGAVGGQLERAVERFPCLRMALEAAKQLAACRMEVPVVRELQRVDDVEAGFRPVRLRDRNSAVELDYRRRGRSRQLCIEGRDLVPVRRLVCVERRDRSLEDVRATTAQGERAGERRAPESDLRRVVERAILVGKKHELVAREARGPP